MCDAALQRCRSGIAASPCIYKSWISAKKLENKKKSWKICKKKVENAFLRLSKCKSCIRCIFCIWCQNAAPLVIALSIGIIEWSLDLWIRFCHHLDWLYPHHCGHVYIQVAILVYQNMMPLHYTYCTVNGVHIHDCVCAWCNDIHPMCIRRMTSLMHVRVNLMYELCTLRRVQWMTWQCSVD